MTDYKAKKSKSEIANDDDDDGNRGYQARGPRQRQAERCVTSVRGRTLNPSRLRQPKIWYVDVTHGVG
jgi:hypothetical protein